MAAVRDHSHLLINYKDLCLQRRLVLTLVERSDDLDSAINLFNIILVFSNLFPLY